MFPIEKYRYAVAGNKVIAITTYAGKTVRGVAVCHENDNFDLEVGKKIAAARCAVRVAEKRLNCSEKKVNEAEELIRQAENHLDKMEKYYFDAQREVCEANDYLDKILGTV